MYGIYVENEWLIIIILCQFSCSVLGARKVLTFEAVELLIYYF